MTKARILAVIALIIVLFPVTAAAQVIYTRDQNGAIIGQALPTKTVILTFDDGPSLDTPQILDILKQKGVTATFFVVGNRAVKYPLLKRIYSEGHDIGNHTYSHANLSTMPLWHIRFELNITRIIINSQIDHSTRLFRPPYLGSDVLTSASTRTIQQAGDMGYVSVGESIDSRDWQRPGVEQIVKNATNKPGGIILLHDGGGDRSQTVEALPRIIAYYQDNGYRFATVSQALGLPRAEVMPVLSRTDRVLARLAVVFFTTSRWLGARFRGFILVMIIASFARFFLVTAAALIQSRRRFRIPSKQRLPCSIIIPAYNEATVIQSCLASVLASHYPNFEVIVVDDGSKDDTFDLARKIDDPRLRVFRKQNGGKASALNYGIALSKAPFFIAIDADTVFRGDTVSRLMRYFVHPRVGAVSGNTKIVNRHKLITKLQSLEYIVGFNLDRRMGDLLDCITVVPGAVGAFRRSAVDKVGGFTMDTLAEDTDLTIAIKELNYTIVYDAHAIALTEAPATVKDLLKQRFRWTFGTMQAVWKHKKSLFNPKHPRLGLIGLPYLLFFQIIFPLFSPLFDLALIISLLQHHYGFMLVSFGLYTLADVITAAIALDLDNERLRNLWILIPQRLLYRQLMYYVIIRSFIYVLKGKLVHWGKLKREGTHLAKVP